MMRDSIVQISRIMIMMSQILSIMSELGVAGTRDQDEEAHLGCDCFIFMFSFGHGVVYYLHSFISIICHF
jgi:hypothetical protein